MGGHAHVVFIAWHMMKIYGVPHHRVGQCLPVDKIIQTAAIVRQIFGRVLLGGVKIVGRKTFARTILAGDVRLYFVRDGMTIGVGLCTISYAPETQIIQIVFSTENEESSKIST